MLALALAQAPTGLRGRVPPEPEARSVAPTVLHGYRPILAHSHGIAWRSEVCHTGHWWPPGVDRTTVETWALRAAAATSAADARPWWSCLPASSHTASDG